MKKWKMNKRHKTEKKRRIPALIIVIAVALASIAGITFARYVLQKEQSGVAEAKHFYFTSDLLKDKSEDKSYYIDPESTSFAVQVYNRADSKRVSDEDITYEITVENGTAEPGDTQTLSASGPGQQKITITPASGASQVRVTVTSKSPYVKVLSALFQMGTGRQYNVEDSAGNRAAVLNITCTDTTPVILKLPAGVIPDATDSRVAKMVDGNGYTFTPSESGRYSLTLLKADIALDLNREDTPYTAEIDMTTTG